MSDCVKPNTICWDCANATGNCSWSDFWQHEPVKGWYAVRNDLHKSEADIESYIVISCPEFVRDAEQYGQVRKKVKK